MRRETHQIFVDPEELEIIQIHLVHGVELRFELLRRHVEMRIVHLHRAHPHQSEQLAALLVAITGPVLRQSQRQIAITARQRRKQLVMMRTVHRLEVVTLSPTVVEFSAYSNAVELRVVFSELGFSSPIRSLMSWQLVRRRSARQFCLISCQLVLDSHASNLAEMLHACDLLASSRICCFSSSMSHRRKHRLGVVGEVTALFVQAFARDVSACARVDNRRRTLFLSPASRVLRR